MNDKENNMKKLLMILSLTILLMGCVYGQNETVKINGIAFEIPEKYSGGEIDDAGYRLENNFSIECVDDDIPKAIGLWASEHDYSKDLTIGNHPVRHYCQYNKYVDGNHSHAYFASDNSIYEISWTGEKIPSDIKRMIENTPDSKIDEDSFYFVLDKSVDIYKQDKIDQLNKEGEYNYLESKYNSQLKQQNTYDDTGLKEILLTYYH